MANEISKPPTQAKPQVIPLSKIHDLPNVFIAKPQDKSLGSMVLSIESSGIKEPVILRQRDDGEYQLLSGYRRRRASELAKKQDIPAHVYEMTMQEAIVYRKAVKNNPNAPIPGKLLDPSTDKGKGAEAPAVPGEQPKEDKAPAAPGEKLKEDRGPTVPGEQPKEDKAPGDTPAAAQPPEAKGRKRNRDSGMSQNEMNAYRELIRENIRYDDYVQEHPYDAAQLDEMVELMVEAVCSIKKNIRVAGNDFPQAVVKSRLLKLDSEHIRFVFDCLRENTIQVRNMKQYLLTVLYNAPATIENHYAAQVNHDLYGGEAA